MSNSYSAVVTLGQDPEELELGGRTCYKLRGAEKAASKRAETRWLDIIVGGPDTETAANLKAKDQIFVAGELVLTSYTPKKGKNKGKKQTGDEIPFGKIVKVLKSPTFFASKGYGEASTGEPTADAPEGDAAPDLDQGETPPDLSDLDV